jgi:hypothetical protein
MDTTTIIRIVAGCLFLGLLAIGIVYIAFLSGVLRKCSPASRTMEPGMVWLLLVPLLNVIWNFLVVTALARSLGNEFRLRNIPTDNPEPGKSIGIAMCVCGACSIIPIVNIIAALPNLILWVIYWVKIAEYARRLDQVPATPGFQNPMERA